MTFVSRNGNQKKMDELAFIRPSPGEEQAPPNTSPEVQTTPQPSEESAVPTPTRYARIKELVDAKQAVLTRIDKVFTEEASVIEATTENMMLINGEATIRVLAQTLYRRLQPIPSQSGEELADRRALKLALSKFLAVTPSAGTSTARTSQIGEPSQKAAGGGNAAA